MHLVQLSRGASRVVAVVDGDSLHVLDSYSSVYELARNAIQQKRPFAELARQAVSGTMLDYDAVYFGDSEWRLLCPIDHPMDPAHVMVSGTGLTHKVSAENRAAMHDGANQAVTDSMRMYQLGKDGGRVGPDTIGAQPEWFYKGNGSILRAHGEKLVVPSYARDGGEEAEIAGAYLIADDGQPFRLGFVVGNEFSDHVMEKENYLYLAPSKLRCCSLGPELVIGDQESFHDVFGAVAIKRQGGVIWRGNVFSGEKNMCHSLENIEHHHFKYEMHRRPGDVHIHFFGADAFSFGEGVRLEDGDLVEIGFSGFGRPLKNPVGIASEERKPLKICQLL